MRMKYKTRSRQSTGEWSDERMLVMAEAVKSMSDSQWASRLDSLVSEGDAARAETAVSSPPPYVLRALSDGDSVTVAAYMQRRGAEYDFGQWARQEGIKI